MPKKLKTYIVPTVVHCSFGIELEVEADSKADAIRRIKKGEGRSEDGYDWDRFQEDSYEIGDWRPITVQED